MENIKQTPNVSTAPYMTVDEFLASPALHMTQDEYFASRYYLELCARVDRERAALREAALANPSLDNINAFTWQHDSQERPAVLLDLLDEMRLDALFWPAIYAHWSRFDRIDQTAYSRRFREHKRKRNWSPDFWSDDARASFDALPDPFTAYWGGDKRQAWQYCWTLDLAVAESFAHGHRGIRHPNPEVLCSPIRKNNVCMFVTDRSEAEIVLFRRPSGVWFFKELPKPEAQLR